MPVVTRASNNNNDMEAMQREIMEMVQQLQKKTNDTEMNITNFINIKCDTLEENVKHYINSVVFAYIDNIVQHTLPHANVSHCMSNEPKSDIIVPASNQTGNEHNNTENTNTPGEASVPDHSRTKNNGDGDASTTSVEESNDKPNNPHSEQEHKLKTNTMPCRLKAAGPSKPVHEVYIGGLEYGTSEDDVRACLMDLNVDNIRKVTKISDDQSVSSCFHVIIVADTIKETVYGVGKFPLGVIVKPFRLYLQDGANKHKHLISTNRVDATREMPIHNSAGTSTYTKLSTKNRHSRTHSFSAPRWRGHADNSMPNPHNSRANSRQQPQTSHLDYTQPSLPVPDYRQPQVISQPHQGQPQQFSQPEYRHSYVTPSHSTSYNYSPPMNMHSQQTVNNNYHRPEVTNVLPYPVTEYNNDRTAQMLPYPINNNHIYPGNPHRY